MTNSVLHGYVCMQSNSFPVSYTALFKGHAYEQ